MLIHTFLAEDEAAAFGEAGAALQSNQESAVATTTAILIDLLCCRQQLSSVLEEQVCVAVRLTSLHSYSSLRRATEELHHAASRISCPNSVYDRITDAAITMASQRPIRVVSLGASFALPKLCEVLQQWDSSSRLPEIANDALSLIPPTDRASVLDQIGIKQTLLTRSMTSVYCKSRFRLSIPIRSAVTFVPCSAEVILSFVDDRWLISQVTERFADRM